MKMAHFSSSGCLLVGSLHLIHWESEAIMKWLPGWNKESGSYLPRSCWLRQLLKEAGVRRVDGGVPWLPCYSMGRGPDAQLQDLELSGGGQWGNEEIINRHMNTGVLGSGTWVSLMEKLQHPGSSACLLSGVEQRSGVIAYSWTSRQSYYIGINKQTRFMVYSWIEVVSVG